MDGLELAAVVRARSALDVICSSRSMNDPAAQAKAFIQIAYNMLGTTHTAQALKALREHPNELIQKATAHALGDEIWSHGDAAALAASYIASIAEFSLLDQLIRYARVLPVGQRQGLIASGYVANVTAEGAPKVVKRLDLSIGDIEPVKAAAIVVLTLELAGAAGGKGLALFERELQESITRATNLAVLDELTTTAAVQVPGVGDPLADLRAGLRAAGPSNGYVVAAPSGDVADLSTRTENRAGMGVRGGTFVPGIEIVAMDDLADMHIIPASRIAMWDGGLRVGSAGHATVNMSDTPSAPSTVVSLWQTNSIGLLAERNFHLEPATEIVIVGAES